MFLKFLTTSTISIGAFSLGIIFERNFKLFAQQNENKNQVIYTEANDVIDSKIHSKFQHPPRNPITQISKYGFPSLDSVRSYSNFVLSYDRRNRVANWVLEYVTAEDVSSDKYSRSGIDFQEDKSFHQFFRSTNQDYKNSGYDRGHLAAAGNYRSNPEFIKETYFLSNIAPQVGRGFNRNKWNELEQYCRKKIREVKAAWICTGPLYLPHKDPNTGKQMVEYEVIGRNHVAVPTHFFKVILYQYNEQYFMESYVMPNKPIDDKIPINSFRVNPEVIERAAGILLFNNLSRNKLSINP